MVAFAASALASALGVFAANVWQIAGVRLLIGGASSIAQAMILAWLVGGSGSAARGRVMARSEAFFSVTGLVIPALGGLLAGSFGWRVAFVLGAIAAVVGLLAVLGVHPRQHRRASGRLRRRARLETAGTERAAGLAGAAPGGAMLLCAYLATFVVFFSRNGLLNAGFPVLGADKLGLEPFQIGLLFSTLNAVGIGAVLLGGRLGDRNGRYRVLWPDSSLLLASQVLMFLITDQLTYVLVGLSRARRRSSIPSDKPARRRVAAAPARTRHRRLPRGVRRRHPERAGGARPDAPAGWLCGRRARHRQYNPGGAHRDLDARAHPTRPRAPLSLTLTGTVRLESHLQEAAVPKPYSAVGLIPTVRGIRKRAEIQRNLDHLAHLIAAASWLSSLDLPVRLVMLPGGRAAGLHRRGVRPGPRHAMRASARSTSRSRDPLPGRPGQALERVHHGPGQGAPRGVCRTASSTSASPSIRSGEVILKHYKLATLYPVEHSVTPHDVWDRWVELYGRNLDAFYPVADTEIGRLAVLMANEGSYRRTPAAWR